MTREFPAASLVIEAGEYGEVEARRIVYQPGTAPVEVWTATAQAHGRTVRGFGADRADAVISCLFAAEDAREEMPQRVPLLPPQPPGRVPGARLLPARNAGPQAPAQPAVPFTAGDAPVGTVIRIEGSLRENVRCKGRVFEKTGPASWSTTGNEVVGQSDAFVQHQADRDGCTVVYVPGPPSFRGFAHERRA